MQSKKQCRQSVIDFDKMIAELGEEISACDYRYGGTIPAYYQQELRKAITALIDCRDSLNGLHKKECGGVPHDPYKVDQLMKMLAHETSKTEEHYGARLRHHGGDTKILTIDAGGLRVLISHYATHRTDLENQNEEA